MNPLLSRHQVTRLDFEVGQPYEKFRTRYEAAVPAADRGRLEGQAGRHAFWPDVKPGTDHGGPGGFVLYWRGDMTSLMTTSGDPRACTGYLMGSRDSTDGRYGQDPAVLLYVPLRTLIYIDSADRTRFAVDQPSTVLAGFPDPLIGQLGTALDRQLAGLLGALGVSTGQALLRRVGDSAVSSPSSRRRRLTPVGPPPGTRQLR
jgi:hypothetical protein